MFFSSRDGFSIDSSEAVDFSGDSIFLKCEKVPFAYSVTLKICGLAAIIVIVVKPIFFYA
jgi:hypothetical protein